MPRKRVSALQRRIITQRANGCCEYCLSQEKYATQSFAVEHIIPVSRGGTTSLDNLALSCPGCNGYKYNKTEAPDPEDETLVPLYNPRQQRWRDHFRWDVNANYMLIIGLTPTGRATVERLKMNREQLVNLRTVLRAQENHPPDL